MTLIECTAQNDVNTAFILIGLTVTTFIYVCDIVDICVSSYVSLEDPTMSKRFVVVL
jgi:hypothetical protein